MLKSARLIASSMMRRELPYLERVDIPREVAVAISGCKTENIYRRYDIVDERDLSNATVRMNDYLAAQKVRVENAEEKDRKNAAGTLLGTPEDQERDF